MSTAPSQKELLELEQSKVPGSRLLEAAASFLRGGSGALEPLVPARNLVNGDRKSLAPREEFVLKLLLKRLSHVDHVLDRRFWFLLSHLIDTIPVRSLAHLLAERDFLKSLDQALGKGMVSGLGEEQFRNADVSSDEDSGRPTKKRKLALPSGLLDDADQDPVPVLICQSIAGLVQLTEGNAEVEDVSSNAVRNVLSAAPEDAAATLGKLLQLTTVASEDPGKQRRCLVGRISSILLIWKYRRRENVTANGKTSDHHFTTHCLRPALRLIEQLTDQTSTSSEATVAVRDLERLVVMHSILPLRALFLSETAQKWKAKTTAITWHDVKDLHVVLDAIILSPETEFTHGDASRWTQKYYSIAVRAIPRPTVRRAQLEQPWLDCLFCACAYLGDSNLPRMVLDKAGHLESLQGAKSPIGLSSSMEELFSLATAMDVKLSLPVLFYFMTVAVEKLPDPAAWYVMTRIVEQDVNVLVPGSGLLETRTLLERVFDAVSITNAITNDTDEEEYALVRDGLVRPLLNGFAQARDIKGFVSLWLRGMQESIQQRSSGGLQHDQKHLSFIWEDEALFRDFESIVKALTTPSLTQDSVEETLKLLHEAAKRVGPTSDILSHVAITTSLLSARPEDFNTVTIAGILNTAVSALSRRSDYQLQRWRLWRLLRQCQTAAGPLPDMDEQLRALSEKEVPISLSAVPRLDASPQSYARDSKANEALECFHLTVWRSTQSRIANKDLLETELEHLIQSFSDVEPSKSTRTSTYHESADLNLSSSCVGILLQYPQILQHFPSATGRLVAAVIQSLPPSTSGGTPGDTGSIVKGLLLSEEISSSNELFNQCCSALLDVCLQDAHGGLSSARSIFLALPLQALKKGLAQKLADVLVKRIKATASSVDDTLADLGLLEMLTTIFSVSIAKPKRWTEFVALAEHVFANIGSPISEPYQTALGCISQIFDALRSRCESDEMPFDMSEGLTSFQSCLQGLTHAASPSSPRQRPDSRAIEAAFELSEVKREALEHIATQLHSKVSSLGQEKSGTLADLMEKGDLDSRDFLLMSAIVCQTSATEVSQDMLLRHSLSSVATLHFAFKARTTADLSLALETCKVVLENHPSAINQHTIDTLLSSIIALASSTGIFIPSATPSAVFNRLCTLLGLALSRYRKRLGGRHHLLLPALQELLKCLFFAGTSAPVSSQTKSQILFIRTLPSWLRSSANALPPASAAHLTRLLTTICDPSTSSLRSRKRSELTDTTKKAKSLAGQYMQYLIQSYCIFSLQGRLPSSSKEKLMPGLYSVLEVMDREVMRGMNGSMDGSNRAIFKSLYDEYHRFGRWDRK